MTDDDIESTKAPLLEHLIELRRRLIWTMLAVFVAFLVCYWFAKPIYNLLLWPYRLAAGADVPIDMIYTAPQEFFFTQVKLALFGAIGLVLAPVYMLRLFQGAMQGPPAGPVPKSDIYVGQLLLLAPLVVLMFAIGLDPNVMTNLMTSLGQAGLAR